MWLIRQTIRTTAVGEDGVQRPQLTRNRRDIPLLPQPLAGLSPCAVMDFLAETANPQDLFHLWLPSAIH